MKKKLLLFWGHFWSYGCLLLTFLLAFAWAQLCIKIEALSTYSWGFFTILGIGLCINGLNLILATLLRKPHILLIDQFTTHQKINPDEITWNEFDGKPYIGAGILWCILGLSSIVAAIIIAI